VIPTHLRRPQAARPSARRAALLGLLVLGLSTARAEIIELTDILGRTIRAELVSADADNVKIRRADGAEFQLEIKALCDEDQARVKTWAESAANSPAANPAAPSAKPSAPEVKRTADRKNITLSASRFKGDTNTIAKFEGYSHKHEQWGYSFQVTNGHPYPLDKVRLEYNLYARTYPDSSTPALVTGVFDFPAIGANRSEKMKTKTAEVCKRKGTYVDNSGGELRGIWARLYVNDELMHEFVFPTSLKTEVEWAAAGQEPKR
jgi:hypothetical protein